MGELTLSHTARWQHDVVPVQVQQVLFQKITDYCKTCRNWHKVFLWFQPALNSFSQSNIKMRIAQCRRWCCGLSISRLHESFYLNISLPTFISSPHWKSEFTPISLSSCFSFHYYIIYRAQSPASPLKTLLCFVCMLYTSIKKKYN